MMPKPRIALSRWIKGHVVLEAADATEAQKLFDQMSARALLEDGYDDIEVYDYEEPELPTSPGKETK